ncbi:hypothetical protein ACS72_12890 [Acinetobacter sp. VT 511]|jgi:hypothetical protein|uniref:hypothetical protein n=1 Tax=Acinetobacter sp. VT 511 TaxID=1675902 RepID=UPI000662B006|nr:hypothetical protein [Acinetobacter sp. VT 511]KMU98574.1 hypothetical protein ACS72_12890 [Acinetobacter sp. VT 511]
MPIYENKADHRPPNWSKDKKSKWIVEVTEEEEIFFHGYEQNWLHEESESIWAIKVEDESPLVIGEDHRPKYRGKNTHINLVVAKFIKHREDRWHGYPVNTVSDFPPSDILKMWQKSPGVKKKTIVKLNKAIK